jgi:ATP-dependent helicase HrpA
MVTTVKDIHRQLQHLNSILPQAMLTDRIQAKRRLRKARQLLKKGTARQDLKKLLHTLEKQINTSIATKTLRHERLPSVGENPSLPISKKKNAIIQAIKSNPVVIVSGETGSGKTTQIPKFCLEAGRGIEGLIGCTQPRRIAAITVSNRIAEEMGESIGQSVGYKIRFKDKTSANTYIKIMTDGILLAETQGDPYLNLYDTIIVDEAHERSLNIDFVLGILKTLLTKRRDLRLIITSATIDTMKFSKAFDDAPVIEVSGRTFPVETRYLPPNAVMESNGDSSHIDLAVGAAEDLIRESSRGDILVFLPTEQDIRETCDMLSGRKMKRVRIMPLFARLSATEQQGVFKRSKDRKIIVATNIAETSITIPGIRYVVDTGLARISQYTPKSRITALPVVPISQSSADQRKGRCGRMENGLCIRLFSEEDYRLRPLYTKPEILRSNLAEVILRMLFLRIGSVDQFPFIDPPHEKSIQDGFKLLLELNAIKRCKRPALSPPHGQSSPALSTAVSDVSPPRYELTPIGRIMAKMPIDPRLSRIIIEADKRNCLREISIIASALSIQDPRERPLEKEAEADEAHKIFKDPRSDFLTLLNIWHACWKLTQNNRPLQSLKKFCKTSFISFKRMREWQDINNQISSILKENRFRLNKDRGPVSSPSGEPFCQRYIDIHKSILSGFLTNIARKKEKFYFKAARDREVMIFPGSGLFDNSGPWIVAAEMIETSRLFARSCANIDSNWLEEQGKNQCRYTYLSARWSRKQGAVIADEQVSLYGLIIVPKRTVPYGRVNPEEATDLFIRRALIPGDVVPHFPFLTHNLKIEYTVQDMESRIRRRDIRVDDEDLFCFYQKHLARVYDVPTLKKIIRENGGDHFLMLTQEDLMRYEPDPEELANYPESIRFGKQSFPLKYQFETGKEHDGVTVNVPVPLTDAIAPEHTDWLIPGLFKEKVETLIKGLPKQYRKQLVPISTTLQSIIDEMPRSKTPLASALSSFLYKRGGVDIPASAWPVESLPDHLKMRFAITDSQNKVMLAGRDLTHLKKSLSKKPDPEELVSAKNKWEKEGIEKWDFGDLPESITLEGKHQAKWILYPGLEVRDKNLCLSLFTDKTKALKSHKEGVVYLFTKSLSKELKFLKINLRLLPILNRPATYFGGSKAIEQQIYRHVIDSQFQKNIRKQSQFISCVKNFEKEGLHLKGQDLLEKTTQVLNAVYTARTALHQLETANHKNSNLLQSLSDLKNDMSRLVPHNFVGLYDNERLNHIVRYIKGMQIRAERAVVNFEKDRTKEKTVSIYTSKLNTLITDLEPDASQEKREALEAFFWLLEEFKVSLFAQELKTATRVSEKKLKNTISVIERMV